jgi:hypothetical protein
MAQGDTVRVKLAPPESEVSSSAKSSLTFPELIRALQPATLPIPKKYSSLDWSPPEKLFDSARLHLNFNFAPPQTLGSILKEKPLKAFLLVAGAVAGMLNHQVVGIDKEIEINTMQNIYSRNPIPESARQWDNSFSTDKKF